MKSFFSQSLWSIVMGYTARLSPVLALVLLLTGCATSSASRNSADERVRVVAWNLQWFPGMSPRALEITQQKHRDDIAAYLPNLRPDIFIAQEIRDEEAAQFLVEHLEGLELHVTTNFQRPQSTFSQQIFIASRYPARAGFAEVFTGIYADPNEEPHRGFAFAALESPWGGTLLVYGVHLKSNLGDSPNNIAIREESARQILGHVEIMKAVFAEHGPLQVIVAGDFNVLLEQRDMAHERTIDLFKERGFHWGWEGVPFRKRVTWPASGQYGDACFDHILTYNLPTTRARVMRKPDGALSDHQPVLLQLSIATTP